DDPLADPARGARDERDPILEHGATLADPPNVRSFRNGRRGGSVRRAVTTTTPTLPDALRLGPVHLTVPDVARAAEWYERSLGLVASPGADGAVELGDGSEPVLVLHEDRDARPATRREAGLYHYALLYASRRELA